MLIKIRRFVKSCLVVLACVSASLALVGAVFENRFVSMLALTGVASSEAAVIVDTAITLFFANCLTFLAFLTGLLVLRPMPPNTAGRAYLLWKLNVLASKYRTAAVSWIFIGRSLQVLSVIAGIVVSGIVTQDASFDGAFGLSRNTLIIVISSIGSASAALLTQLRFEALARAREIARVGVETELLRAKTMLPLDPQDLPGEALLVARIQDRLAAIEYDQIDHVFPPQAEAKDLKADPEAHPDDGSERRHRPPVVEAPVVEVPVVEPPRRDLSSGPGAPPASPGLHVARA